MSELTIEEMLAWYASADPGRMSHAGVLADEVTRLRARVAELEAENIRLAKALAAAVEVFDLVGSTARGAALMRELGLDPDAGALLEAHDLEARWQAWRDGLQAVAPTEGATVTAASPEGRA